MSAAHCATRLRLPPSSPCGLLLGLKQSTQYIIMFAISAGVAFDRDKIAAAGHPDVVVVLVTNSDDYGNLTIQPGPCKAMDQVIQVK